MAAIKSIKVGEAVYDLKATYDGSGNVIDLTYAKSSTIPTKVSLLENDAKYLEKHLDISGLATKTELESKVDVESGKGLSEANYTKLEKQKLSGIADNANNYVHPTGTGYKHIPPEGTDGLILTFFENGTAQWANSSSKLDSRFLTVNEELQNAVKDLTDLIEGTASKVVEEILIIL